MPFWVNVLDFWWVFQAGGCKTTGNGDFLSMENHPRSSNGTVRSYKGKI